MSRFVNLSIIIPLALLIMNYAGINTGATWLLNQFGLVDGGSLSTSAFIVTLLALYAGATAAGIVIGFFTKASFEWAILAGAMTVANLFMMGGAFDFILSTISGEALWIKGGIGIIFAAFSLLYAWSAAEFVFNR